jgi:RNA polymerase sigma-70 factor (ECF subfamily)
MPAARSSFLPTENRPQPAPGTSARFDEHIAGFVARLRGFIRSRVRDDATADDLTQETLLKVYRSRSTLLDNQRLEAWLYRIARRTLIDHYRQRKSVEELPADLAGEASDFQPSPIRDDLNRSLHRFLDELPDLYREPVRLAEFENLPLAKIALRLDLSLTAVKSRVQRGRALLKKKLQACCRFEFDRLGKIIACERHQPASSGCCIDRPTDMPAATNNLCGR